MNVDPAKKALSLLEEAKRIKFEKIASAGRLESNVALARLNECGFIGLV